MARRGISTTTRYDCVVVGAGVVGAAIAQHVARLGLSVAVLERAPGIGGGCSYANAALVAPHHVTPLATPALLREAPRQMLSRPAAVRIRPRRRLAPWLGGLAASALGRAARFSGERLRELATRSAALHEDLAAVGHNPGLRRSGALDVYLDRPRRMPPDFLPPADIRALEPAVGDVAGGTHRSEEWVVDSRCFVTSMLEDAVSQGADVSFSTPVMRLLLEGRRACGVMTPGGEVRAGHVVIAAGLGSAALAAPAGLRIPLRGGRGYVTDLACRSGAPSLPVRVKEHRVVVTPLADRVRVAGALEFGTGAPRSHRRSEALRAVAARAVPALRDAEVVDRWTGLRPCTSDGLPVIGGTRRVDGLSVATGHGMWGLTLAPITAHVIAQGLLGAGPDGGPGDSAWLGPDRFSRQRPWEGSRQFDHAARHEMRRVQ